MLFAGSFKGQLARTKPTPVRPTAYNVAGDGIDLTTYRSNVPSGQKHQLQFSFMNEATESGEILTLPAYEGTTYGADTPIEPPGSPFILHSGPGTGARFPFSQAEGHVKNLTAIWMRGNGVKTL